MSLIVSDTATSVLPVRDGWELCVSAPGRWDTPDACESSAPAWHPAIVPGTAASSLEALGLWHRDRPTPLHDQDLWYRVPLPSPDDARNPLPGGERSSRRSRPGEGDEPSPNGSVPPHPAVSPPGTGFPAWISEAKADGPPLEGWLRFRGLATMAEAWIDGRSVLRSDDMFVSHEVAIGSGRRLHLVFRSLTAALAAASGKRARWRTSMIPDAKLRFVRTTLLGHMPGWSPAIDTVGPWRPVEMLHAAAPLRRADVQARLEDGTGHLSVSLDVPAADTATLCCAGSRAPMHRGEDGRLTGTLAIPDVAPWWPHTHGTPALHDVHVEIGPRRIDLAPVGFRELRLDRGTDGRDFRLLCNGVPVFCRGAAWMPPDPVDPGHDGAKLAASLDLVRRAGLNMLRISGTTVPPPARFHDLCDRLGILVWQDLMLANFDYPFADPAFAATVAREVEQLLDARQASPSFAILCGGSEVGQQAAMMGCSAPTWTNPLLAETVRASVARLRPDTLVVDNSPSGGDLPFAADAGCTHYFGVGAYRRPLDDARRARVRFASECLAFANVPEPATLRAGPGVPAVHHPDWKAGVPRDLGAAWDFEDVRDHYLALLYGIDPPRLRSEDPERYLALSRAVVADVIGHTISEWRRPGSGTNGALLWTWQDLRPGAGWGLIDHVGRPKSAWYGLARASRPVQLLATDEGVNGLALHACNDGPAPIVGTLALSCLRDGRMPVAAGRMEVTIPARSGVTASSAEILGRFFDVTYAYRFGPADHDSCHAVLAGEDGTILGETTHWLPGRRTERHPLGLKARAVEDGEGWALHLSADRMAAALAIDDEALVPDDNYLDLAPGREMAVRLRGTGRPSGIVRALNGADAVRYSAG